MKWMALLLCVLGGVTWGGPGLAQGSVQRFELESKATGARYEIEVVVPAGGPAKDAKYPAIYCTDWFMLGDYLKALPKLLNMGRLTEPFILVGISGPGTEAEWAAARTRDFTPAPPTDEYSKRNTRARAIEQAGGSARFVTFLREELIPRVQREYPADPARRGFLGYSLGGLLGVRILATDPGLFDDYLLGSPSLWYNEFGQISELEKVPAAGPASIGRVYLSVGEEESWEMLKGFGALRSALKEKGIEGERLKAEIIPEAGHVGAMPIALYNGVRFLYRRR
jgi:predicted alpha/beta superfamily hydrolase